jgi:A/G-specific adenine glycosylase
MLQQTQVATAIGYYERFLKTFPTVRALAAADEQAVLAAWAGLGYYRRARLLHAAAKQIVQEHAGQFPKTLEAIENLPGVGRYTAGAVYSFAYDKPAPIIEANTARLLARLFAIRDPLDSGKARAALWERAQQMLPNQNCREHNYALMELGSLVCKPAPKCDVCPLAVHCAAYQTGQTQSIPRLPEKPQKLYRSFCGVVARCGDQFLVRQIPKGEWHAGMFEFPAIPVDPHAKRNAQLAELDQLLASLRVPHGELSELARYRYTVTRHSVVLDVFRCEAPKCTPVTPPYSWLTLEQIDRLPLGSAQRKLLDLLKTKDDLLASVL